MTLMSETFPLKVMLLRVILSSSNPRVSKLEDVEDWTASGKAVVVLVVDDVDGLLEGEAELDSGALSSVGVVEVSASFFMAVDVVTTGANTEGVIVVMGVAVVEVFVGTLVLP